MRTAQTDTSEATALNAKAEEISMPPAFPGVGIKETAKVEKTFKTDTSNKFDHGTCFRDMITKNGNANVIMYSITETKINRIK